MQFPTAALRDQFWHVVWQSWRSSVQRSDKVPAAPVAPCSCHSCKLESLRMPLSMMTGKVLEFQSDSGRDLDTHLRKPATAMPKKASRKTLKERLAR